MAESTGALVHLTAEFLGATAAQLSDERLLNGLLIAAAGAAGLAATGAPVVTRAGEQTAGDLVMLDGCRISVLALPDRQLLLLDILTPATRDPRKALEVFTRRLEAREVRSEQRARG